MSANDENKTLMPNTCVAGTESILGEIESSMISTTFKRELVSGFKAVGRPNGDRQTQARKARKLYPAKTL